MLHCIVCIALYCIVFMYYDRDIIYTPTQVLENALKPNVSFVCVYLTDKSSPSSLIEIENAEVCIVCVCRGMHNNLPLLFSLFYPPLLSLQFIWWLFCTSLDVCVCIVAWLYVCVYVFIQVVFTYVGLYLHVMNGCAYVYDCMCVCVYVKMYVCTYTGGVD